MWSSSATWRRWAGAVLVLAAAGGCYEEIGQEAEAPPPAQPAPAASALDTPRPALGAARRTAQNTAQKVEQQQRAIEEALEED